MARRRRRGRRAYGTVGGFLRSLPRGFTKLLLASGIMAVGGAVGSALSGNLVIPFTIGSSTINLDLGFIPGMIVTFGGLFLFYKGMRLLVSSRI